MRHRVPPLALSSEWSDYKPVNAWLASSFSIRYAVARSGNDIVLFAPRFSIPRWALGALLVLTFAILIGVPAMLFARANATGTPVDQFSITISFMAWTFGSAGVWGALVIPQWHEHHLGPALIYRALSRQVHLPRANLTIDRDQIIRLEAVQVEFPIQKGTVTERQMVLASHDPTTGSARYHTLARRCFSAPRVLALLSHETGIPAAFVRATWGD